MHKLPVFGLIFEGIALFLLIIFLVKFTTEYFKFRKINSLYKNTDYTRGYLKKTITRSIPFMPSKNSEKYKRYAKLLTSAGWRISVENFYLLRFALLIIGFALFVSIHITNVTNSIKDIKQDLAVNTSMVEAPLSRTTENISKEVALYEFIAQRFNDTTVLLNPKNKEILIAKIQDTIKESGISIVEQPNLVATRLYVKLLKIALINNSYTQYVFIILFSFLLYKLPVYLAYFKMKLMANKAEWEIVNLMNIFTIFGTLPPHDIRNVLENMKLAADVFQPTISELFEGVKNGKGNDVFDEVLNKTEHKDLYKLIEVMKIARTTGLYGEVGKMNKRIEAKLKRIEIDNIRRRESKLRYVMIPLAMMILFASLYFMLGTNFISNPSNLMQINN